MKRWVFFWTKFLFALVAASCFLHFVGDMSIRASIAIALLASCSWSWASKASDLEFSPHQINLQPYIGSMLIELGLITDEKWKALMEPELAGKPWDSMSLAKNGIRGVVLSVDSNGQNIVHWPEASYYTSSTEVSIGLDFLKLPGSWSPWSPDFFFRSGSDGYHWGIAVKEEWWKGNQNHLLQAGIVKSHDTDYRYGTTRLTLEVLPHEVFWIFYRKWNKRLQEDANQKAKAKGWKVDEIGGDEMGYFGDSYKGKYGTVWLRFLPDGR
jgi:hypothetical protein